ncbi:MFS transporter [Streptomyces chlorus]|uniref:MFS transporter n=1 Tax=Streptomyces chlorus TaxID=887452 RepID=A0ABW1E184_9ACTN
MTPTTDSRAVLMLVVLSLAGTAVSLNQSIALPLLPDLPRLLDTDAAGASWLLTATLLAGALATPTISRLADMYGKKRMVLVSLVAMVVGSLIGALTDSLAPMLVARALQGTGMALVPVGIALMRDMLPPHHVPLGVALMSATLAVGAGVGMPLSGLVAAHLDWHALFWITGGLGAVVLLAIALVVDESPVRSPGRFDLTGALLLSVALSALLLALSKGGTWGWTSRPTLVSALCAVLALAVWVPQQLRARRPVVDLRVAVRPEVLLVNLSALLMGFAMYTDLLVTSQLLQAPAHDGIGLGMDLREAGLWLAPNAVTFGLMAPVTAGIVRRCGPRVTLLASAALMGTTYLLRSAFSSGLTQVVAGSVAVAVGASFAYAAMPTLIMRAVPESETASGNGLNTLLRAVGTALASSVVAAVTTGYALDVGAASYTDPDALMAVFQVSALMCLGTVLLTVPMFFLRGASRPDAI